MENITEVPINEVVAEAYRQTRIAEKFEELDELGKEAGEDILADYYETLKEES